METIQIRLERKELQELERLRQLVRQSRSEVTRKLLTEGLKVVKGEIALERYAKEEISLAAAAEFAGLSIAQMAEAATAGGIPYFRYSPSGLQEDLRRIRERLK